jgi:hypothetical protein
MSEIPIRKRNFRAFEGSLFQPKILEFHRKLPEMGVGRTSRETTSCLKLSSSYRQAIVKLSSSYPQAILKLSSSPSVGHGWSGVGHGWSAVGHGWSAVSHGWSGGLQDHATFVPRREQMLQSALTHASLTCQKIFFGETKHALLFFPPTGEYKSCSSRKMLKNEPTLAIVAVDTAENEPL